MRMAARVAGCSKPRQVKPPSTKAPGVKTIQAKLIAVKLEHSDPTKRGWRNTPITLIP